MKKYLSYTNIGNVRLLLLCLLPILATNCEEVIPNYKVENAEPKVVIEAHVSSYNDSEFVILSKTGDYMNATSFPALSGATVNIEFNDTTLQLTETKPGFYSIPFVCKEKVEYFLTVLYEGVTYTATAYIPKKVEIIRDSIKILNYSGFGPPIPGLKKLYQVQFNVIDPADEVNFYRIKVYKNDSLFNSAFDLLVNNDDFINGINNPIVLNYGFESKDTVKIEMQSIDKASYTYYMTLKNAITSTGNFSVPDNPTSNINGDALGHFFGYSADTIVVVIP